MKNFILLSLVISFCCSAIELEKTIVTQEKCFEHNICAEAGDTLAKQVNATRTISIILNKDRNVLGNDLIKGDTLYFSDNKLYAIDFNKKLSSFRRWGSYTFRSEKRLVLTPEGKLSRYGNRGSHEAIIEPLMFEYKVDGEVVAKIDASKHIIDEYTHSVSFIELLSDEKILNFELKKGYTIADNYIHSPKPFEYRGLKAKAIFFKKVKPVLGYCIQSTVDLYASNVKINDKYKNVTKVKFNTDREKMTVCKTGNWACFSYDLLQMCTDKFID